MVIGRKKDLEFTNLLCGKRISKYNLQPDAYGTIDELNSFLGLARAFSQDRIIQEVLITIQNHLFIIGSELALCCKHRGLLKGQITQKEVDWLDQLSIRLRVLVNLEPKFVLYGGTQISGILDVARAVSRRTERLVVKMKSKKFLFNIKVLKYLNNLSNLLYLLARYEDKKAGVKLRYTSYHPTHVMGKLLFRDSKQLEKQLVDSSKGPKE